MSILTFNEEIHEYRLDGRILPSVTQILGDLGFVDNEWFTEEARLRGIYVHQLCEYDDLGILDPSSVHPKLKGYLTAWRHFRKQTEYVWTDIEDRVFHSVLQYAGTLDRRGISGKGKRGTVDIKTGPTYDWHSYQLGGYLATQLTIQRTDEALTVRLQEDGSFRVNFYDVRKAIEDWKTIVNFYHLKNRSK